MPRLKSDLFPALLAATDGVLDQVDLRWRDDVALTVVLATQGYPGDYEEGSEIRNVKSAEELPDVTIFHAGTETRNGALVATGGAGPQRNGAGQERRGGTGSRIRSGRRDRLAARVLPARYRVARDDPRGLDPRCRRERSSFRVRRTYGTATNSTSPASSASWRRTSPGSRDRYRSVNSRAVNPIRRTGSTRAPAPTP